MRTLRINFCVVISLLIAFSLTLTSCGNSGQDKTATQSQNDPKKDDAIKKIKEIEAKATFNNGGIQSILKSAEKATMNFDTYVYLANLASEFGYQTGGLVSIAEYASQAKVETDYFRQLGDLNVMKLSETQKVIDLALAVSKLSTSTDAQIEKQIQELKSTADFKTMDEARVFNKKELDKMTQQ
jgi:hypothetical protein